MTLGFAVTPLAARVHYRTPQTLPRTHMLLLVHADGADWLSDVGFGGEGLLLPVPLGSGEPSRQFAWTYRAAERHDTWMLQSLRDGAWEDMYAFTREPQELADYEMANYWVSTHPSSRFVQTLTVQLPGVEVRHVLRNRELTQDRGSTTTTRTIVGAEELPAVLARHLRPALGARHPAGASVERTRMSEVPRIWYQSFVDPVAQRPYISRLQALLDTYAAPGIRFEVHGIDPPDRYLSPLTELRCAGQAVRNAIEAQRSGCAAFVFGHFQDAGLLEARTAVDIPVLGLGETTMLHALTLGRTFGLVTINPVFLSWLRDQIIELGLTRQSVGCVRSTPRWRPT